jgi:hypothetical protein
MTWRKPGLFGAANLETVGKRLHPVQAVQFRLHTRTHYPDIPNLPVTQREMKRVTKLIISNRASYAAVALDLEPPREEFRYPGYEPEGDVVFRGTRPDGGRRGDIGPKQKGGTDNRSTAPLDWYTTYVRGGKMQRALEKGVNLEFKA